MIVEFIGSTGSGKTSLISKVHQRLEKGTNVSFSFEAVAAGLGLGNVTHPTIRNLIQEVIGFPYFICSLFHYKPFVSFIVRMLRRHAKYSIITLHYLRSLERTMGVYEIIRRIKKDVIILLDEGTLVLAHNVFGFSVKAYYEEEITEFSDLVPLPDLIIYVRAPLGILIERSLQRTDPPREMRARDRVLNEQYLRRSIRVFDQLVNGEKIRDQVFVVDNPGTDQAGLNEMADSVSQFIYDRAFKK